MSTIKEKAVSGVMWSSIENFTSLSIQLIIGIIIARLVSPEEFGLVAMTAIFMGISQNFILFYSFYFL